MGVKIGKIYMNILEDNFSFSQSLNTHTYLMHKYKYMYVYMQYYMYMYFKIKYTLYKYMYLAKFPLSFMSLPTLISSRLLYKDVRGRDLYLNQKKK